MKLIQITFAKIPAAALLAAILLLIATTRGRAQETPTQDAPASPPPVAAAPAAPTNNRVFGVLPNYRTADGSLPHAPISARRKLYIGFKDSTDYPIFFLGGFFAAISQAEGSDPSFGGGLRGYGKRYAANLGDQMIGNFMSESVYPVLLRQDPRYFRRGAGSGSSRTAYALSRVFVTRNDSGRRFFNFSEVLGVATAVAISNTYSPDARQWRSNVQKFSAQIAVDAIGGVLKEFWPDIKRKLFSHHKP